jgi:hypothetical protein
MGYEVHITRKENWFDDGPEIALEEWLNVVRSDVEMRLDGHAEATVGAGAVLRMEDPSMSVWVGYSKHGQNGNMAWLWHSRGNVMANNPDEEILRKMSLIATRLSAKVQGDEGELYGQDGNPIDEEASTHSNLGLKPWWRFW